MFIQLAQGHTGIKGWGWVSNPDSLPPDFMFNIIILCSLLLSPLTLCPSPLLIHFGIGLGQTNLWSGESKDEGSLLLPILPSSSGRFWEIVINSQGPAHLLTSSNFRGTCRNREDFPKPLIRFHRKAGTYITLKHP